MSDGASIREKALEAAAVEFVAKVERGDARSTASYAAFKAALATPPASPEPSNGLPTLDEYRNNLVEECARIAESSAVTSNGTKIGIGIASKIRALAIAAPAQSNGDEGRGLPLCCVTGRIAGDGFACGDCDPCGAAHAVPQSVKTLLEERDHFADKYSEAACECDTLRARLAKATAALTGVSQQCGNVIFNCEQRPADNQRHLDSWKGVKEYTEAALKDIQS